RAGRGSGRERQEGARRPRPSSPPRSRGAGSPPRLPAPARRTVPQAFPLASPERGSLCAPSGPCCGYSRVPVLDSAALSQDNGTAQGSTWPRARGGSAMSETRLAVRRDPAGDADIPAGSAVLRAVRILEAIASSEEPPPLAAICRQVALPKATVYRILGTLEFAGYIAREPGSKVYATGERLNRLAGRVLVRSPSRAARHAILEELAEQVGESCNLTVPQGNSVLYLDRVEVAWPLKTSFTAGSCAPMHASASGKIFLSAMPRRARERFVRISPLISYTPRTQVDPSSLLLELE